MSRKVVEIPLEVWEFSLQDAEHIVALHRETLRLMNENARLKAEVERLRKAGDELLHEWSSGDETDGSNFKKGLVLWNAAKEGKPTV